MSARLRYLDARDRSLTRPPRADRLVPPRRRQFVGHSDFVATGDEFAGHLMVFRTFDKVSYALVMSGVRPIHAGDTLKHPDAIQ